MGWQGKQKGESFVNRKDDMLILERAGEDEKSYLNAVTPPIFMNSLHVFDTFEEYHDVDVFEKINFIMDVRLIQPPVLQKKRLQNLNTVHGLLCFPAEWRRLRRLFWQFVRREAILSA